jgi:adenylate kinase family enzyme
MKPIFCFSGRINSGKTTLSKLIAENNSFAYTSFGDCVRSEATKKGIEHSRFNLQELGSELVKSNLHDFCKKTIYLNGWDKKRPVIIDGIRHKRVYEAIVEINHSVPVYLIHITRENRSSTEEVDSHETEKDATYYLDNIADLVVLNDSSISQAESIINGFISGKLSA